MVRIRQEAQIQSMVGLLKCTDLFSIFFTLVLISEKHYAADIDSQLRRLVATGNPLLVTDYLDTLSNARFRTAGYILCERTMLQCPKSMFWALSEALVEYNSRAFLVTVLKAFLTRRNEAADVGITDEGFRDFCCHFRDNNEDCRKILQNILPVLDDHTEMRQLFSYLGMDNQAQWIPFLLKCHTLPSSFLLFNSLHFIEHDTDQLERIAYYLIRSGDSLSYNLASLMKAYFGLSHIKGTFSLNLKPYELARIATSYSVFCQKMLF